MLNSEISIAPNPATTELYILFASEIVKNTKVTIIDILGKELFNSEINEGKKISVPVNELSKGVYFVKIEQGRNYSVKKFIKE